MTHPEELLAGYVEGTLPENERALVATHLQTCETCRDEVDLATMAVAALAEIRDEPVPLGLTSAVIAESGRRMARPRPAWWRGRLQWVAGLAAAAAVIAFLAVGLPHLHGGPAVERAVKGGLATASSVPGVGGANEALAQVPLETQRVDYGDVAELQTLAEQSATRQGDDLQAAASPTISYDLAAAEAAMSCVTKAAGEGLTSNDTLARLIRAKFEGKPAYLGVYLERPGAKLPPDQVVIWVASSKECRLLSFASKTI
jgi:predicted anti-sigma-YlaC factor YlaD